MVDQVSNPYNCPKCGEWCSGSDVEHVCQDTRDRARIESLEQQVDALRTLVLKLWRDHYGVAEHAEQDWEATPEEWAAAIQLLDEAKQ